MLKESIGFMALVFILETVPDGARAQEANPAPQLRITQVTGKLEINAPDMEQRDTRKELPAIRSGSIVRVLSGDAWFVADNHALLQAKKGDAFLFVSRASSADASGSMTISAVEDGSHRLVATVGNRQFFLRDKGTITLDNTGPDEVTVKAANGDVEMGTDNGAPGVKTFPGRFQALERMPLGDSIVIKVAPEQRFQSSPISMSYLRITEGDGSTFEAAFTRPALASDRVKFQADKAIASWPDESRALAAAALEKYGAPTTVHRRSVAWDYNGPWKRTVIRRGRTFGAYLGGRSNLIEQTVDYDVPQDKTAAIEDLGMGLRADARHKELSAGNRSEEVNFLALNLANDVLSGKINEEQAKASYTTALALRDAGKSSSYLEGLLFEPSMTPQ